MDFKYIGNENVNRMDIDLGGSHCTVVKQAAGWERYAQCNNCGTLNGLEKKVKKIVLVIKHVSFFPAVFALDLFRVDKCWLSTCELRSLQKPVHVNCRPL
jgi:hypothetical protein